MQEKNWQINKQDVVFTPLENEGVILNLRTKYYFTVNDTGLRIWQLLEQGSTTRQIVSAIAEEYDVSEQQCQQDVETLLMGLQSESLIA